MTSADQAGWNAELGQWLAAGHHATMDWMEGRQDARARPRALWPQAQSIIMLGMNYGPESDPLASLAAPELATISVYARGRDYHQVLKGRLKTLAQKLKSRTKADAKVFVDTAPVMEKPLAQAAGIGWQGKHTVLVSRRLGNWLFLGAIYTAHPLEPDEPESDHCGTCTRCLAACPTDAFPAPYLLDSRRCISYLTIEHKGHIDRELRAAMGNRIYGCDDCLAVCPWNKFAEIGREAKLKARADLEAPPLVDLLRLDDAAFRQKFSASPIKRTGRDAFMRNVLIAAGNAAGAQTATRNGLINAVSPHLDDPNAIVRAAAIWALARLDPAAARRFKQDHLPREADPACAAEWSLVA